MSCQLLINNKSIPATERACFERNDPVTGRLATRAAAATKTDAVAAVVAAAAAFPAWSALGPGRRRAYLFSAADQLATRASEFADLMVREIGATREWARFNVQFAAGLLREAGAMTTQITGEVIPSDKPGCIALAVRQPAGVVLGMAPWNAPIILGVRAIAMPLACGNTVVLKGSEICPGTHRLIAQTFVDAGLPEGVVNFVTTAPADAGEIVETLIGHPAVRRINFTGSTRVGRIVAESAARHLKPVLLELGGKASLVVLDDADITAAVNAAAFGAFMNQGQICMSTERIIVDDSIADEFVSRLSVKAASLTVGDPQLGTSILGSMASAEAAQRVRQLIREAVAAGAVLASGGSGERTLLPATVLDRVTSQMRIYHEESFGPIVAVVRVNGTEAAVHAANDTEYGLSSAVFSRDVARALSVARRIEAGICHVNGPTVSDEPQMPFGGMKSSGYGRFGGKSGIAEFTELRWITLEDPVQHYPF